MTLGAKILAAAAVLCLFVWGLFLGLGAQPLKKTGSLTVIYGEQEDFHADASVYQKVRNETVFLINTPRARPAYRWWSVDFNSMAIRSIDAPPSLGSQKYLLRRDQKGTELANKELMGDWFWHFTEHGAAFSGNGFMCSVKKARK